VTTQATHQATYIDPRTNDTFPIEVPIWRSPSGNPLMLSPVQGIGRSDIQSSKRSIWRYQKALPLPVKAPISMGEGCTPLFQTNYSGICCQFKLEWFSPTGSFKDRGTSVMLSLLREQGIKAVLEDSSGNGGSSIAGYGAAGGMRVKVLVPQSTSAAKIVQMRAYGAEVELVPGPREATEAAAIEQAANLFYASHNWHPFFLQGTKTLGYEIWEDCGFKAPDNIVIPASAGSNLLGCHIAFNELLAAGEIGKLPKLFVSQPANCAPLHASFQAGGNDPEENDPKENDYVECEFAPTVAEGTAIKRPIRLLEMLNALRQTGGQSVVCSEAEIIDASLKLARQGLYVEPTCAHAAAGLVKLVASEAIKASEQTVVILTGTGLKTSAFYEQQMI